MANQNTTQSGRVGSSGSSESGRTGHGTSHRGFASMDEERQREIASKGGKAAHASGNAHEFDSREAAEAGRKGGETVSRNREHMAEIGAEGGRSRGAQGSSRQGRQSGDRE